MSNKVKVPGGAFYAGDGLTVDQTTRTVSAGGGSSVSTPDYNQNDETASDYIKNRPFYTGDPVEQVLLDETEIEFSLMSDPIYYAELSNINFNFEIGETYKVYWDGTLYECIAYDFQGVGCIGSQYISTGSNDTGEPFIILPTGGAMLIGTHDSSTSHTVSISANIAEIVKIDEKYIPKLPYMAQTNPTGSGSFSLNRKANTTIGANSFSAGENVQASGDSSFASGNATEATDSASTATGWYTKATALGSSSFGGNTEANGRFSHAEGVGSIVSSVEMNLPGNADENGMGYCGHAEGHCTLVTGKYASHAEGYKTKASGDTSHAEGRETVASGDISHTEGKGTVASGDISHAEGKGTVASGDISHAEGWLTKASGASSHAEGTQTTASGDDSHTEGKSTAASGNISHAEGGYTKASSDFQHVQGRYNIEDTNNIYADIVGNGTPNVYSNAYTLDWDGNGWFAGTVEADAIILRSSTTDSSKKFKITVDDSGKISATEVTA